MFVLGLMGVAVSRGSDSYQFRWFHYRPGELRIIMDTSVTESGVLSHSSSTHDVRGWLLCIDLESKAELPDRTRIYGPLWSVTGEQSWLNHADGVAFTDRDRKARVDAGFVAFDDHGDVVRIRADEHGVSRRARLRIADSSAEWIPNGVFSWVAAPLPPGSEDTFTTLSHRYRIHRDPKEGSRLFESLSGDRVDDRWLEQAFETYRGMKEMGNVRAFITNERDYLICFPMDFWNRMGEKDAPRRMVDTFEWKGTTYDRKQWAFYFKRGSLDPVVFRKPEVPEVTMVFGSPSQTVSINGEPALLYLTKKGVVLVFPTTHEVRTTVLPPDPATEFAGGSGVLPGQVQHLPEENTLAFLATHYMSTAASLYLWNYQTGQTSMQSLELTQLFRKRFFVLGLNGPSQALPVKESGE